MGNRPLPAHDLTCHTLAALRYPEARERMRVLGVGPEAFEFSEERVIATWFMRGMPDNPAVERLLVRDDGRHLPWGMAISWTLSPELAVITVERFAAARAVWWVPRWLTWIAEGLRAGNTIAWAIREFEELLTGLRPLAGREGPL